MAGKDNLKVPTSEEAREYGSRGGKASGQSRKEKKMLQDALDKLLKCKAPADNIKSLNEDMAKLGVDTSKYSMAQLVALAQVVNAIKGNQGAFELIRDTIGEKPVEKQELAVSEIPKITIKRRGEDSERS